MQVNAGTINSVLAKNESRKLGMSPIASRPNKTKNTTVKIKQTRKFL
jgi:hypothetical protein